MCNTTYRSDELSLQTKEVSTLSILAASEVGSHTAIATRSALIVSLYPVGVRVTFSSSALCTKLMLASLSQVWVNCQVRVM